MKGSLCYIMGTIMYESVLLSLKVKYNHVAWGIILALQYSRIQRLNFLENEIYSRPAFFVMFCTVLFYRVFICFKGVTLEH